MSSWYKILGVDPGADERTIRKSYSRLIRVHHPDVAGAAGSAKAQELNEALRVLGTTELRRDYDAGLGSLGLEPTATDTTEAFRAPSSGPLQLLLGVIFILGWGVMVFSRPAENSVTGLPLVYGIFAFCMSLRFAVAAGFWSLSGLFNVVAVALAPLYLFVGTTQPLLHGIGQYSINAGALFAAGSLLLGAHRINHER